MSFEESMKCLSLDYLNLLINGQAFSDVTFSVEGRLVHAHRCILAARSLFFRKFFCGPEAAAAAAAAGLGVDLRGMMQQQQPGPASGRPGVMAVPCAQVIPVNSVGYEVFLLLLQFLYSGQVSIVPQKHEARPNCTDRGCWHAHCTSAIELALDTLAASQYFGVEQLARLIEKQLATMVEKASIEDVMKVLMSSRKQEMHHLWSTCSHLVANSGLPSEILSKHLPIDVVSKIEELRLNSTLTRRSLLHDMGGATSSSSPSATTCDDKPQKIRRMQRALDSSDVELVKLMVMGEGLNLDEALALHYAVANCSREVVKALLELGAGDVNHRAEPSRKTPLHIAAEMVNPDMVAVLLDHHADPNVRAADGTTPIDILRSLTSDFLFKGAVPCLPHIEPNKLRLCLELVQSAALVLSRDERNGGGGGGTPATETGQMVYLNLGGADLACKYDGESGNDGDRYCHHIPGSLYSHGF
ncbi:BTB/POZ domain and ankyrin repeat-containing protein NOOT1-like [Nymphaea colorata]|nr:BTB/POZ domain and ankyrin repeat-containing protein NOOT1-like [Nymphaea colorata]